MPPTVQQPTIPLLENRYPISEKKIQDQWQKNKNGNFQVQQILPEYNNEVHEFTTAQPVYQNKIITSITDCSDNSGASLINLIDESTTQLDLPS